MGLIDDFASVAGSSALTLCVPDWIEAVFHADPDQRSGSFEWVIVGGLTVTTLVSSLLARREWRRVTLGFSRTR